MDLWEELGDKELGDKELGDKELGIGGKDYRIWIEEWYLIFWVIDIEGYR